MKTPRPRNEREQRAVRGAFERGAPIERFLLDNPSDENRWEYVRDPDWDWATALYRVVPGHQVKPKE